MTTAASEQTGTWSDPKIFDRFPALSVAMYLSLSGYGFLVGAPVISTAWVTHLGFSEVDVGQLASADLGGLALGSLLTSWLAPRVNRRFLTAAGLLITIVANALCIGTGTIDETLALRLGAGFGSGIVAAISIATLGASSKPARAFNILLLLFAFSQTFEMTVLPMLSMAWIYGGFIIASALGLLMLAYIPPHPPRPKTKDQGAGSPAPTVQRAVKIAPWLCLAAIALTYINIGAYWTYIELASTASATTDQDWVATLLSVTSFLGITGCLVATLISDRFGLARPLLVTLIIHAVIVGMLCFGINNINIAISLFGFNFLWIFIDVYQTATIANIDKSGRYASLVPGAQGLGEIIGPGAAALTLATGGGYSVIFLFCAAASLLAFLAYGVLYLSLKKHFPLLADAP